MRLISQDGMTDCPYESSSLYIKDLGTEKRLKNGESLKESGCCGIQCNNNVASFRIAEYSTKEKALKVMSKLRKYWADDLALFYFPADEEVEESD